MGDESEEGGVEAVVGLLWPGKDDTFFFINENNLHSNEYE